MIVSKAIPFVDKSLFMNKVRKTEGCWLWKGYITGPGYGAVTFPGHSGWFRAHRVSYMLFVGELTQGLVIDHICRNKKCVNPSHLRQVSQRKTIKILEKLKEMGVK